MTRAGLALALGAALAGAARASRPNPAVVGAAPFRRVVRSLARFQGATWVGTYGNGLFRLEGPDVRHHTAAGSPLLEDRVNCLAVRGDTLWVGTCGGINLVGPDGFGPVHRAGPGSVAHDIYHVIEVLRDGTVAVGTTGHGLSLYKDGAWRTLGKAEGLLDLWVNAVAEAEDGTLFVATHGGLYSGRPETGLRFHRAAGAGPDVEVEVVSLAFQGRTLWVGTATEGLFALRDGYWVPIPAEHLKDRSIPALEVDPAGTLWVGTGSGLARYRLEEGFTVPAGAPVTGEVKVLYADPEGGLWVGLFDGRVLHRPPDGRFRPVFEP